MTPSELEARVRYLERMRFMVGRQQLSDDVEIEALSIPRPQGDNPSVADGPVVIACDGFCQAPSADLLYELEYKFYSPTSGMLLGAWTGSGTMVFRNRPVRLRITSTFGLSGPYWYTPPIQFYPTAGFFLADASGWFDRLVMGCSGPPGGWNVYIYNSVTGGNLNNQDDLSDMLVLTEPPELRDYVTLDPSLLQGLPPAPGIAFASRNCPFDYRYRAFLASVNSFTGAIERLIRIYRP